VRARGVVDKPALALDELDDDESATVTKRPAYWDELGGFAETLVVRGASRAEIHGPALIELPTTVIVVRPGAVGQFDPYGNFVMRFIP
jgi:N-methylhydantoinase A/oxoprolinase/acetone carboxylase beta subunit